MSSSSVDFLLQINRVFLSELEEIAAEGLRRAQQNQRIADEAGLNEDHGVDSWQGITSQLELARKNKEAIQLFRGDAQEMIEILESRILTAEKNQAYADANDMNEDYCVGDLEELMAELKGASSNA